MRTLALIILLSLPAFAVRSDCTKFVSTTGSAAWGSCTSAGTTCSITTAFSSALAGEHVCVEAGTYVLSDGLAVAHSGNSTGSISGPIWYTQCPNCIVFEDYDNKAVTATDVTFQFPHSTTNAHHQVISDNNQNYIIIQGFTLDGQQFASNGVLIQGTSSTPTHHVLIRGNNSRNMISAGIGCQHTDYCDAIGNIIYNAGANPNNITTYATSCSQGITHNLVHPFDSYAGIHQIVAYNFVASSFCHTSTHSDGGGYLLDNADSSPSPWTAVIGNVMYGNGGRCMGVNTNNSLPTVTNFLFVNNTCFMNNLDLTLLVSINEYEDRQSNTGYWINNISVAWPGWSGQVYNWHQSGTVTGQVYKKASWFNGLEHSFTPSDETQFLNIDTGLNSPPVYDNSAGLQWQPCGTTNCTPDPITEDTGNAFALTSNSPYVNVGIDPTTVPGIPSQVVTDMQNWVYTDIAGVSRPQGSAFDLGAYELPLAQRPQCTLSGNGVLSGSVTITCN